MTGSTGIQGPTGLTGLQGPIGLTGQKGDTGNAITILTGLSKVVAQVNSNYCLTPTNQPVWNVIGSGASFTNVFIDGSIMPLQYLNLVGYSGYLKLIIPNPFPGSTLTLQFSASTQGG